MHTKNTSLSYSTLSNHGIEVTEQVSVTIHGALVQQLAKFVIEVETLIHVHVN